MAKINKIGYTPLYASMQERAKELGERVDCSVKAIAAACNVSYDEARAALQRCGRKDRHTTDMGTILDAVVVLGKHWQQVPKAHFIARYPKGYNHIPHVTSHHPVRFPLAWQDRCNYLMSVRGHVLAITDGEVHDWSVNKSKRAQHIYRITD